jgi:hypothetical protein
MRTFVQSTRGSLTVHARSLARVSHSAHGSALYAGKNLVIPLTESSMEAPPFVPLTAVSPLHIAETRATPLTSGRSDVLMGPQGQ